MASAEKQGRFDSWRGWHRPTTPTAGMFPVKQATRDWSTAEGGGDLPQRNACRERAWPKSPARRHLATHHPCCDASRPHVAGKTVADPMPR